MKRLNILVLSFVIFGNLGFSQTTPPVAEFGSSNTSIGLNTAIFFTDESTNNPTGWQWSIYPEDGWSKSSTVSLNDQDIAISFRAYGCYTIQLEAWNDAGTDKIKKTKFVRVLGSTDSPVANFYAEEKAVTEGSTVEFFDMSGRKPTSWEWMITPVTGWQFAPGSDMNSQNPSVIFNDQGNYSISLKALNSSGENTKTKNAYIIVGIPVTTPVVDFSADITMASEGSVISFTDLSTNSPNTWGWTITPAAGWAFNAGSTANSQNPSVMFNDVGFYTVSLEATNGDGSGSETKMAFITIEELIIAPVVNFSADKTVVVKGETVNFTDLSINEPVAWAWSITPAVGWEYGAGTTEGSENPVVIFNEVGDYSVALNSSNSAGDNTESKTDYISVTESLNIEELGLNVNIYPNPFNNELSVDLTGIKEEVKSLELLDIGGKSIIYIENPLTVERLSLPNKAKGIYFLNIHTSSSSLTKKITKL